MIDPITLYTPPFRHVRGYIFDSQNNMVCDDGNDSVQRIRGWGRIQKMPEAAAIQDAMGDVVAKALTEYWSRVNTPAMKWIPVSDRLPTEDEGEVFVHLKDGRNTTAWATYWHGASTGFAEWTFPDADEDGEPTHWMKPAKPNEGLANE